MPGSELIGDLEFNNIKEIFGKSPAVLYRYHPDAFMVKRFEELISDYFGVQYAHAVSSGTAAIETALYAAGVRAGDEVITTAFTFVAPVEAILKMGAIPVCVEIDETLHLDPAAVEDAISGRTRAICAIPMWGPCAIKDIQKICSKHGIALVEDAAQCLGGTYKGSLVGTFGKIGSFSLDFGKTLTAGEGGFIITDDEETYRLASEYSDHGHVHDLSVPRGQDGVRSPGFNYRISELTGAVAAAQFSRIDDILCRQRKRKERLEAEFSSIPGLSVRATADPAGDTGDTTILTLGTATVAKEITDKLMAQGIGTKILPEAFRWHYAGAWTHVWEQVGGFELADLRQYWPETYDVLSRSVALGISVNENPGWDEKVISVFREALEGK